MTKFAVFFCYYIFGDRMKAKYLILILLIVISSFFIFHKSVPVKKEDKVISNERRGIFVSYIELSKYLKGKSVDEGKKEIHKMIDNIQELGFTMVLLQVRSFSDAIYPSNIYPWSATVSSLEGVDPGYDVLQEFIAYSHKKKMEIHAWINPYRIRGDEDSSDISTDNPAFSYLNTDTVYVGGGIYYNPAKEEVRQLIVDGVSELVEKYPVDGVLFDDYFYPNKEIDLVDYQNYSKVYPNVSIDEFRLQQVNLLIQEVYQVCHKKGVAFGISPDGNIENNYQKNFADVRTWGSTKGYIDYLMPQIYYGFYNETKAFHDVIHEWNDMITNTSVELLPVLAFYKVGTVDPYAKSGKNEWIENDDIIMREILMTRNLKKYDGFSLFRYDYLFNDHLQTDTTMLELNNMKKVLN